MSAETVDAVLVGPPVRPDWIPPAAWARMSHWHRLRSQRICAVPDVEDVEEEVPPPPAVMRRAPQAPVKPERRRPPLSLDVLRIELPDGWTVEEVSEAKRLYDALRKAKQPIPEHARMGHRIYRRNLRAGRKIRRGSPKKSPLVEAVRDMASLGMTVEEAAIRRGILKKSLERELCRAVTCGGPDVLAHLRRNGVRP